jgi:predicted transcriptional regulator
MKAKNKILKTLKDNGGLTPSRIAGLNGLNYKYTLELLNELKKEKFVTCQSVQTMTIWEITKQGLLKIRGSERRIK